MASDSMASRVDQLQRVNPNSQQGAQQQQDPPRLPPTVSASGQFTDNRMLPSVNVNKDRPPLDTGGNYQDLLRTATEQVRDRQQPPAPPQQQVPEYTAYEPYYDPRTQYQYVRPTFWSENRYAILIFIISSVSIFTTCYYIHPRLTTLLPGKEHVWLTAAVVAFIDAWLFQTSAKYV